MESAWSTPIVRNKSFGTIPLMEGRSRSNSFTSLQSLVKSSHSEYQNWLKRFYSSRLNEMVNFEETSHVLNIRDEACYEADDIIEPCLLDCHTQEGFVSAATHIILHMIKTKQQKSETSIATIGLSGGSSPREIFTFMGNLQDLEIDFNRIILFLVDERYVPEHDEMSNSRLVMNTLLKYWPIPRENIIFPDTSLPLQECVEKYEEDLARVFGPFKVGQRDRPGDVQKDRPTDVQKDRPTDVHQDRPVDASARPDLITLGIGEDFHIAGLFPEYLCTLDTLEVTDCPNRVMITYTNTAVVRERITLSLPFLCMARSKLFFLKGEIKKKIWTTMLQYRHVNPIRYPATQLFLKPGCIAILDSSTIRKLRIKVPLEQGDCLTMLLFGSTGDLSRKKLFPALFHLFYLGFLPNRFKIIAVSRSHADFDAFFETISQEIFNSINTNIFMCDPAVRFDFPTVIKEFKHRLGRVTISHEDTTNWSILNDTLERLEVGSTVAHRMIYLATPAEAYHPIMRFVTSVCGSSSGWFRVMAEKPFGRDFKSCLELKEMLTRHVEPNELFLVDHYLGKPIISCIIAAKRSSQYSHIFNNRHIQSVHIQMKETIGTFGRQYYNKYGSIRDMIQNHGMQLLSLIAMDRPDKTPLSVTNEKLKLLKHVRVVKLNDLVIGQYGRSLDGKEAAYVEEKGISKDSLCDTYCSCLFWIDSETWRGVPFVITAGKALNERVCQVKINLRKDVISIRDFRPQGLVFRLQPQPAVLWVRGSQMGQPGSAGQQGSDLGQTRSDLGPVGQPITTDVTVADITTDHETDTSSFRDEERIVKDVENAAIKRPVAGAYELLLYHAFRGKRDYFPSLDEVIESWRILTPALEEISSKKVRPHLYPRGSAGPVEAQRILGYLGG